MEVSKKFIILMTKEKEFFKVELEIALVSNFIKNLFYKFEKKLKEKLIIPLYNIETKVLSKIIEYCRHEKKIFSTENFNFKKTKHNNIVFYQTSNWLKEFFKINKQIIIDLINAAFYLDIEDFIICATKIIAEDFFNNRGS